MQQEHGRLLYEHHERQAHRAMRRAKNYRSTNRVDEAKECERDARRHCRFMEYLNEYKDQSNSGR